jgi:hypothetical protein
MDVILIVLPKANHQNSMVSESASGTRSLETRTMGIAPQSPSLIKLSFVIGMGATRILLTSARPRSIWPFSTSNPKDAKDLKGKGLKPTSTFIRMALMELVARKTFLRDLEAL